MSIQIQPLKLPLSDKAEDNLDEIRLRLYQAQLKRCESPVIVLKAPTGSGKTLAYLIRAIGTKGESAKFGTTIIVYPTNSLIWDQARALAQLIKRLGKSVNITFEKDNGLTEPTNYGADVDLFVLNGESLSAIAQESKTSEGIAIIKQLNKYSAKTRIFLTNPEILYLTFLYRFNKNEKLIQLLFDKQQPNLLIFDEFHLYHGFSLASLSYMLSYIDDKFDQIIFSSATPIKIESIIDKKTVTITAEPSNDGDIVKKSMNVKFYSTPHILNATDIPKLKTLIDELYEKNKNSIQSVKVLVILNSIVTCIKLVDILEKDYPNLVTPIHGLIPSDVRPKDLSEFNPIVIGTSAIEVGIDFDTCSLIFEAQDTATFLQRIGRGSRHNFCETHAFVPSLYYPELIKKLPEGTITNHIEFELCVRSILPDLPDYSDFPTSKEAVPIMMAILLNWTMARPAGGRKLNSGQIREETKKLLAGGEFVLPKQLNASKDELTKLCDKVPAYGIYKMAQKLSCRSSMDSIPAIFRIKDTPPKFDYLSLIDLPRLEFSIKTKEKIEQERLNIPWKMRLFQEFIEVRGIRNNQEKVRISITHNRFNETPEALTQFHVITDEPNTSEKIEEILKGQPAFLLDLKEDWRLPGFYTTRQGGFLSVGGDAFLAHYIHKKHSNSITTAAIEKEPY
jgi:CRISPR-associated helicase Cas3